MTSTNTATRYRAAQAAMTAARSAFLDAAIAREDALNDAMWAVETALLAARGEGGRSFQETPGGFDVETESGAVLTARFSPDGAVILDGPGRPRLRVVGGRG